MFWRVRPQKLFWCKSPDLDFLSLSLHAFMAIAFPILCFLPGASDDMHLGSHGLPPKHGKTSVTERMMCSWGAYARLLRGLCVHKIEFLSQWTDSARWLTGRSHTASNIEAGLSSCISRISYFCHRYLVSLKASESSRGKSLIKC